MWRSAVMISKWWLAWYFNDIGNVQAYKYLNDLLNKCRTMCNSSVTDGELMRVGVGGVDWEGGGCGGTSSDDLLYVFYYYCW